MSRQGPLNRSTVAALAGVDSRRRIIPAELVAKVEQMAMSTVSPEERIDRAERQCREGIGRVAHAGWQRGYAHGHEKAVARLQEFVTALDRRRNALDAELVGLVADAVERILRRLPPGWLTEKLIESALDEAQGERGRAVLRVHPERLAESERCLQNSRADTQGTLQVIVEADATLAPDDCTLETPDGVIEVGLGTQLAALRSVLGLPQS